MSEKLIFDNLSFGTHFQDDAGRKFIKLNLDMAFGKALPCYYDEYCNRVWFNAVDYSGIPIQIPFDVKCEVINFNLMLDNPKKTDIINSDLNNSQNKTINENNMKTNATAASTAISTTPQLTLKEAVVNAVNELKVSKGNFSAHDVTTAIREAANSGEIALPGLEATQPNSTNIKYWVNHSDVKAIVDDLLNDGTLANLGMVNVNYNGGFRVFEFSTPVPSADDHDGAPAPTPAPNAANPTQSPLAQRIDAYLSKAGTATLKQIQSALKVNGITCKDLSGIVAGLGYTVTPGTTDCFSTYVAA
jgi:hypothetical protein